MNSFLLIALLNFIVFQSENQACLELENPSFELDQPARSRVPKGWKDMANFPESPNDIHGKLADEKWFGVQQNAAAGERFVGLVVRSNFTSESIGQRLLWHLEKDSTYRFSLFLARSANYESFDRRTGEPANFNQPTILKIWGAGKKKSNRQLLAATEPIEHEGWRHYFFEFKPADFDCRWLILEAGFVPDSKPYNGNLLIDNCSPVCKK